MQQHKSGKILSVSGRDFRFLTDRESPDNLDVTATERCFAIGLDEVLVYRHGDVNFTGKRNSI